MFFSEGVDVRGMTRDSRSARLGLRKAELLARDMNKLSEMVFSRNPQVKHPSSSVHNARIKT
jgi:hypothetical protein